MADYPDDYRDLLEGRFATLATLEPDGSPQLSELWFLFDDGQIKFSLNTARRKTQNLAARPQCSLLLLDLENPFRYLEVRGNARTEPDPDGEFAHKLHLKYDADVTQFDRPGDERVVVTLEPTRIRPVDMSA